ncbi:antibiotic biosynthesis monooxygenase family protein [Amycolatopsis jiangsuensis]|uniref:ABM domain-containing protein n=1 Tax=Amycolatopsis jiangsuensis TaxID=1181879 RepID=A0A840J3L7_9PSEU|nr:antibiotic biosynthesis monooxygenase [Amycolatopsis jiangsuensis]MBB4688205.1 hypothetical protein [Amycolatopsis jiangsuensis]
MTPVTTIVHFSMPVQNADRFLAFWQDDIRPAVERQPGLISGTFHRYLDTDSPFQFVNVAHWENAELLAAALHTSVQEMHDNGIDMFEVMRELGVAVSQNNYTEAVRYQGTAAT